jgi:hypothetical protein
VIITAHFRVLTLNDNFNRSAEFFVNEMSIIQDFFKRYLPTVKADEGEEEELVDPQKVLRVRIII